jgi:hypothetical protein
VKLSQGTTIQLHYPACLLLQAAAASGSSRARYPSAFGMRGNAR